MTRTRLGRRKPYILLGAPSAALMFALIPVAREHGNLALFMGTIIFMNFFMRSSAHRSLRSCPI